MGSFEALDGGRVRSCRFATPAPQAAIGPCTGKFRRYLTYEDATEYVSWLHHEAEVVRDPAESVVRGAVEADPDDEYLVGLAGTLGGGDSYLLSVDRHLLDLPDRAVKDGEGRPLALILTPGEFLREIEQE